jgi:hypothetical protein
MYQVFIFGGGGGGGGRGQLREETIERAFVRTWNS